MKFSLQLLQCKVIPVTIITKNSVELISPISPQPFKKFDIPDRGAKPPKP